MDARYVSFALAAMVVGCQSYPYRLPKDESAMLPSPSPPHDRATGGICEIDPSACPKASDLRALAEKTPKADVYAVSMSADAVAAPSPPPAPVLPDASREMLDVEARFAVECQSVTASAAKLRDAVRSRGGTITLDESSSGARENEATLEVRIALVRLDDVVADLARVGTVRAREVKAKDVAKEVHDAELTLHNLEAASRRYEELLAKASTVADMLTIEHELERLRATLDQVKGDLAWMKDRVARATVRVRLFPTGADIPLEPPLASQSSFFPSVRTVSLLDVRSESDRYGYLGAGLAIAFHGQPGSGPRAIVFEIDVARSALSDRPPDSNYAYLVLVGADFYSDLLGGGRRRFLNPFLGLRGGYAQSEAHGDLAGGGVVGLDLWKTRAAVVELSFRTLALFGSDRGAHVAIGPTLALDLAF